MKYKATYQQRFHARNVGISISYTDFEVCIGCEGALKSAMFQLMTELVYDGYAEAGEVQDDCVCLFNPDPWMCHTENLKEIIRAKMESLNYRVEFLA